MVVREWILGPFQRHARNEKTPYRADAPDNTAPPPVKSDVGKPGPNGFAQELARSKSARRELAQEREEDLVRNYNAPVHTWVVLTLFPLIAGTFGPMASTFNVCALASDWRLVVIHQNNTKEAEGHHIQDPAWLLGVNALSLFIAIVANLSLLGQMTNRMRYNNSAPITITGFFISGIIDIALVAAAPTYVPLPDKVGATWSQAFYYAALSGCIYVLLAAMLSVTAYGVWYRHYSNEFKLSLSQRSLMLQTMMFLGYILAAGAVYARVENWTYLDATYFVIVTLFTIGFGDLVPLTHLGRSLLFPMAVGGILYVGVIVSNIRALVLESGSIKVSTRMVEKARQRILKSGDPNDGTIKISGRERKDIHGGLEGERRRLEFEVMRAVQQQASRNNRLFALGLSTLAFCVLWFVGAVVFWQAEMSTGGQNWTYFESVYFAFVAQLTIGYGDYEPQTNSAKPAFVFWALIALPTLTVLIGAIGDSITDFVNWYTKWIGKNTRNIIRIFRSICGKGSEKKEDPRELAKRIERENEEADKGFTHIADIENRSIVPLGLMTDNLTDEQTRAVEEAYRPLMMLRAANKVVEHLDDDPPKEYSYDEWAWLLKLVGEDEEDEEGHRLIGRPLPDGAEVVTPFREEKHHVWSWIGQESPLMSLEDSGEPKWILKRLMRVLEKDLKERAERHVSESIGHQLTRTESRSNSEEKRIESA